MGGVIGKIGVRQSSPGTQIVLRSALLQHEQRPARSEPPIVIDMTEGPGAMQQPISCDGSRPVGASPQIQRLVALLDELETPGPASAWDAVEVPPPAPPRRWSRGLLRWGAATLFLGGLCFGIVLIG